MRIAVYSPAKDEEHNVCEWAASAKDADDIVLVDTGSSDNTYAIAEDAGLTTARVCVVPWRFDTGFNVALAHVPSDVDVCVPLHLDERLEPGWRDEIEKVWTPDVGLITFDYQWSPEVSYRHDRIHARGHRWIGAAHEFPSGPGTTVHSGLRIIQMPTERDRTTDSTLMELAYLEDPSPRTAYYWARELFYRSRWVESRRVFSAYLAMNGPVQERSEAFRIMAKMVWPEHQEAWLLRACSEAPQRRECWYSLALHYAENGHSHEAAGAASRALSITTVNANNGFFLETEAWNDSNLERITRHA